MSGQAAAPGEAVTDPSCKTELTPDEGRRSASTSKGDPAEFRGSVSPASLREMSPHVPIPVSRIPFLQIHTLTLIILCEVGNSICVAFWPLTGGHLAFVFQKSPESSVDEGFSYGRQEFSRVTYVAFELGILSPELILLFPHFIQYS